MKISSKDVLSLTGRLLLSSIFLAAGYSKFRQAEMNRNYMASKKLPAIPVLQPTAATVELLAALSLILGLKPRWGAMVGLLFLIPTSVLFHDFWNEEPEKRAEQMIQFLKNLAIMGGLAHVLAHGPGNIALEPGYEYETPLEALGTEIRKLRRAA